MELPLLLVSAPPAPTPMSCRVSQLRIRARAAWRRMGALAAASEADCSAADLLSLSRMILRQARAGAAGLASVA